MQSWGESIQNSILFWEAIWKISWPTQWKISKVFFIELISGKRYVLKTCEPNKLLIEWSVSQIFHLLGEKNKNENWENYFLSPEIIGKKNIANTLFLIQEYIPWTEKIELSETTNERTSKIFRCWWHFLWILEAEQKNIYTWRGKIIQNWEEIEWEHKTKDNYISNLFEERKQSHKNKDMLILFYEIFNTMLKKGNKMNTILSHQDLFLHNILLQEKKNRIIDPNPEITHSIWADLWMIMAYTLNNSFLVKHKERFFQSLLQWFIETSWCSDFDTESIREAMIIKLYKRIGTRYDLKVDKERIESMENFIRTELSKLQFIKLLEWNIREIKHNI
jgi:hypothetical protein